MQRIVVLNPKGGSGKTTIAVNLAGYYALQGDRPALMDCDPQASATQWVRKRQPGPSPPVATMAQSAEQAGRIATATRTGSTPPTLLTTALPEVLSSSSNPACPCGSSRRRRSPPTTLRR